MTTTIPATGTTIDVFAMAGWSVTTKMVDQVDNQGEPCDFCALDGRYIDATVYGHLTIGDAEHVASLDCCVFCVPAVIREMDPNRAVTVELGDSQDDDMFDDRMHNQDCGCVHPDAM